MKVLVINAGSSSLKYQLLDTESGEVMAKGLCERIGIDGKFTYKPQIEGKQDRKSTRLNSSHRSQSRMPSSA